MLFWELYVVNPINAGPTANIHGASFSREFHPDHPKTLFTKKLNPPSDCQNEGKMNEEKPIKKIVGVKVMKKYDGVLLAFLSW